MAFAAYRGPGNDDATRVGGARVVSAGTSGAAGTVGPGFVGRDQLCAEAESAVGVHV